MKTLNIISNLKVVTTTFVVAGSLFLIGCNKNSEATNTPVAVAGYGPGTVYGGYGAGCTNCNFGGTLLLGGIKTETTTLAAAAGLDLVGDPTKINYYDPYYTLSSYNGSVALYGTLRVNTPDYSLCYAPPGDYQVRTVNAGTMSMQSISGSVLEAFGPNGYRLVLTTGPMGLYKENGLQRIAFTAQVMFGNGQPCGAQVFY